MISNKPALDRYKKQGLSTAAILAVLYLIIPHEGKVNQVYLDPVGVPTACYGQTGYDLYGRKIEMGKGLRYTDEECDLMLATNVPEYERELINLVKPNGAPIDGRFVSQYQKAGYISWVYNLGAGNLKASTMLKMLNAGDHEGACNQLVRWIRAGGKVLPGLVSRRGDEQSWCMGQVPWHVEMSAAYLEQDK